MRGTISEVRKAETELEMNPNRATALEGGYLLRKDGLNLLGDHTSTLHIHYAQGILPNSSYGVIEPLELHSSIMAKGCTSPRLLRRQSENRTMLVKIGWLFVMMHI